MKLVGMSELDVNGILFVEFPDDRSFEENRDSLELLISEVYDEDCEGLNEDECPELVMSPFMVMRALMRKAVRDFNGMSEGEKEQVRKSFWESRERRRIDKPTEDMV